MLKGRLNISKENNRELNIGSLNLKSKVMLAPMAGVTDTVLRQIARSFSVNSLLYTEMISSEALKMSKNSEEKALDFNKCEYPLAFQLSGHKPDVMAFGAKKLEHAASIIDINMGCPAPKIVKNFDGARLMTDINLASKIISAVKNAVSIPVTVKFRLGWDCNSKNFVEFAKMAQDSGADAIILHGRTRSQMYSGNANWHDIGKIKESINIPLIGNGDINSPQKALECLKISNCDGIAIGRGILGDPGLIFRIEKYIYEGILIQEPTIQERLELALSHCKKEIEYRGELQGIKFMRKFFAWYIRNIRGASSYRDKLIKYNSLSEIEELFKEIKEGLN